MDPKFILSLFLLFITVAVCRFATEHGATMPRDNDLPLVINSTDCLVP